MGRSGWFILGINGGGGGRGGGIANQFRGHFFQLIGLQLNDLIKYDEHRFWYDLHYTSHIRHKFARIVLAHTEQVGTVDLHNPNQR